MIAHLYRIRSDFRNVPDKIIIKAKAKENYPGTWLHTEIELPDFMQVAETEYGDGFLFTQDVLQSGSNGRWQHEKSRRNDGRGDRKAI